LGGCPPGRSKSRVRRFGAQVMKLRHASDRAHLPKYHRTVRDWRTRFGNVRALIASAAIPELDKVPHLAAFTNPLMHLSPQFRSITNRARRAPPAAGKPDEGGSRSRAHHRGNHISSRCATTRRPSIRPRLPTGKEKAASPGRGIGPRWTTPTCSIHLPPRLLDVGRVTDVSSRRRMDVVRDTIQKLSGIDRAASLPVRRHRLCLKLPLTALHRSGAPGARRRPGLALPLDIVQSHACGH